MYILGINCKYKVLLDYLHLFLKTLVYKSNYLAVTSASNLVALWHKMAHSANVDPILEKTFDAHPDEERKIRQEGRITQDANFNSVCKKKVLDSCLGTVKLCLLLVLD